VAIFVPYNSWFTEAPQRDVWLLLCVRCGDLISLSQRP